MIRIGVVSDTHIMAPTPALARLVERGGPFYECEMVLHCGDIVSPLVLDAFLPKRVVAVKGNMDGANLALRSKEIIRVMDFSIGLIHGWGSRTGLEERIMPEFDHVDAICYGHTHTPANHIREGVLLFNPGAFGSGSAGILTLDGERGISGRIIAI